MSRARARLTAYKVHPAELLDLIDAANVAHGSNLVVRCPGGRLIRDGYMCSHCGKDPTEVIEREGKRYRRCGDPADRLLKTKDLMGLIPVMID